jgi:predicted NBD/HSP70 family sugar kinase
VTKKQPVILVIDVGGTNVKIHAGKQKEPVKIPSGPTMSARQMVTAVRKAAAGWKYTAASIGYPGPVLHDKPVTEPHNLGSGWVRFDYQKALGCPVQLVNDAAMQALGSYEGGRMLFLGLGTGLGSAMIVDGQLEPMELAHLPYKKGSTYEDYVGLRGLKRLGKKKWRRNVAEVIDQLKKAMAADYVVLGGGNVKLLKKLPPDTRLGSNMNAFVGGARLWHETNERTAKRMKPKRAAKPKAAVKAKVANAPAPAEATQYEPAADEFASVELATS